MAGKYDASALSIPVANAYNYPVAIKRIEKNEYKHKNDRNYFDSGDI